MCIVDHIRLCEVHYTPVDVVTSTIYFLGHVRDHQRSIELRSDHFPLVYPISRYGIVFASLFNYHSRGVHNPAPWMYVIHILEAPCYHVSYSNRTIYGMNPRHHPIV